MKVIEIISILNLIKNKITSFIISLKLNSSFIFNLVKNNAERRTYDDIFWKRMFGSTITKESSVMDRKINEYMVGLDALLEAERIKTEIFNMEHDLWEY